MKKLIIILAILFMASMAWSADVTKTLTFQWDQNQADLQYLTEWKIYWSDSSGGPYDPAVVATIPYTGGNGPFTGVGNPTVSGSPATTVTKYFVCVACGDIPQPDGSNQYLCSGDSNEISYDFWIPFGGFSAPVTFTIVPE